MESAGDFNGDGKDDIVWRNMANGSNALWLMDGTNVSAVVGLPGLADTAWRIDGVNDFNHDGSPDIVLRNYTNGQNAFWIMNSTNLTAIVSLPGLTNTAFEINGPR